MSIEEHITIGNLEDPRDAEIAALKQQVQAAGNLLAIIHRDGGHYEAKHGWEKACKDGEIIVGNLRVELADQEFLKQQVAEGEEHLAAFESTWAEWTDDKGDTWYPATAQGFRQTCLQMRAAEARVRSWSTCKRNWPMPRGRRGNDGKA